MLIHSTMNLKRNRHINSPIETRIAERVAITDSGCWEWRASRTGAGYAHMTIKGKAILVHRLQYVIHKGEIPKGLVVCHSCDNRGCVNPEHLFIGTQADNMQDMKSKGRHLFGEKSPRARLNVKQVIAIRKDGRLIKDIAKEYEIGYSTVSAIKNRHIWAHL